MELETLHINDCNLGIISAGVLFCDDLAFHEFHICLRTKKGYDKSDVLFRSPIPLSEVKSIKITIHLHCLIPAKGVAFNDPRLFLRNAKIRHWAALPHALMQLLTPWFSAQSQQPDAKAITGGMVVKSREKMVKRKCPEYVCRICICNIVHIYMLYI